MTFFLIVPSVMIVSIFLVHAITNRLGLKIRASALALCAVLSILVDLGAVALSPVLDKWYFIRLSGLILSAAALVTLINHFLVKREETEAAEFSAQVQEEYSNGNEKSKTEDEDTDKSEEISESVEESEMIDLGKITGYKSKSESDSKNKTSIPVEKSESSEKVQAENKIKLDKKFESGEKIKLDKKIESDEKTKLDEKIASSEKIQPATLTADEKVKPAEKVEVSEEVTIEEDFDDEEPIETLDDILENAYAEKNNGNLWRAIELYKDALEKYNADEYAPFVAIDLSNVYKEQAAYAKAIKIYRDSLELPAVKRNADVRKEFEKNITYLRAVQSVLLKHRALGTPFSKISYAYLREIETEFQAMQLSISNA